MAPRCRRSRRVVAARSVLSFFLVALVTATGIVGCRPESRHRVLVFLFEDVPPTGEDPGADVFVRRPRRAAPPTPAATPTPVEVAEATLITSGAAFRSWDDVAKQLPKDAVGNPDWSRALQQRVIAPRPGIDPDAEPAETLALDVELVPESDPALKVTFSHEKHGEWLACSNCHPDPFEMETGEAALSSASAHAETACGACHGKVAFSITDNCSSCHLRNLPKDADGRIDWTRALEMGLITPRAGSNGGGKSEQALDLDVEIASAVQAKFHSVFSHTSHTQWLACDNCHPQFFPMQAGGTRGSDLHARDRCGACHGTVSFGLTGACDRCHPSLTRARHHQAVLDLDIAITPKPGLPQQTVFSHKVHTPWVECSTCHANLYAPTASTETPMADFYTGKYCATCHGNVALELIARCQPCHAAEDAK
jgi:c(7)-type cytochrome triheme protein